MKKKVIILGSTGTIGRITFDIFRKDQKNFKVELLSTNTNFKKVVEQAKLLKVKNVIITDYDSYIKAIKKYKKYKINFFNSFSIINKIFKKKEIYYSMISIVGLDGLEPTLKILKYTKNIAISNKESIICAWNLIEKKIKKFNVNFIPVDSEHFSIFTLIKKCNTKDIEKIYLTASGGPFLNFDHSKFSSIKISQALKHPNWVMGKKISIDSSTMMNKLFEVIETKKIFNIAYDKIDILIHPKSYVHTMIKFNNGLTKMLIHDATMKIPIFNSIYLNDSRFFTSKKINFSILNNLEFQFVDYNKFPLLKLLKKLPKIHSLYETILISINDFFVKAFLKKKISYSKLIYFINFYANKKLFYKFKKITPKNIKDIYKARKYVDEILDKSGI